ncbi:hypothetical protein [Peribacillus frigoritolerans]|uniref:hypothetical protein n=1 Tax=Peribacillus frigoritolerans TaxID=450367 RepID=UPI0022823A0E|nr:hypothetical protein [Peribacillus frigoritolerans]MCY9141768.1 hypothetical protein [Peribacillus frigoritolerans]
MSFDTVLVNSTHLRVSSAFTREFTRFTREISCFTREFCTFTRKFPLLLVIIIYETQLRPPTWKYS